jgi:cytosine/adenosine deaminase-related metal-dependent hydrolase
MKGYRAKTIVTMDGRPVDNGAVVIAGNRIEAVGRFAEIRSRCSQFDDLGEVVLLPGLINAHCHLDFTCLRDQIAPQRSFADWIRGINNLRSELSDQDYVKSITEGFNDARRWGTTTIANIESVPRVLRHMAPPFLRVWWFMELIDVRSGLSAEKTVERALLPFCSKNNRLGGVGLSPHAPYTVSPDLLRAAATCAYEREMLLTIHLAESQEEMKMFRDGCGDLFDLLHGLGRPMEDCRVGKTPLAHLLDQQALDERWIVVHLNELTEDDFTLLANGARFHVVHCPRSSLYFGHRTFALERLRNLGFNICLGTDSLASNSSLSLFAEMRCLRDAHSDLAPGQILEMVTTNPARALHQPGNLGRIRAGFEADLIALPLESGGGDIFEKIIAWSDPVGWMLVGGLSIPLP